MDYKIAFEVDADYIWVSKVGKLEEKPFTIPERTGPIKIVAYKKKNDVYTSLGAAIIIVKRSDGKKYDAPTQLTQPRDGYYAWGKPVKLADLRVAVAIPYIVVDARKEYEALAEKAIRDAPGGPRETMYAFDYPFRMSGNYGVRAIRNKTPFNLDKAPGTTIFEKLGAAGYLNKWAREEIDDIAPVWASNGEGKDCEDFAVAVVSAIREYQPTWRPYIVQGRGGYTDHAWVVVFSQFGSVLIEPTFRHIERYPFSSMYIGNAAYTEKDAYIIKDYYRFLLFEEATKITGPPSAAIDRLYDDALEIPVPEKSPTDPYPWKTQYPH